MKVAVTGTPGTGKTEVAKRTAEITDLKYYSLNRLAEKNNCISGRDEARNADIIDIDCLKNILEDFEDCIYDGHISHLFDVDVVVVLRTEPKFLKERLKGKDWTSDKIRENLESELIGIISSEARENCENVFTIDTTNRKANEVAEVIKDIVKNRERDKYMEPIEWTESVENLNVIED